MSKSLLILNSAFDMVDSFEDLLCEYGEILNNFDLRYIDGTAKKISYSELEFCFIKYKMNAISWSMQGLEIKNQIICFFERLEENDEIIC